MKYGSHITQFSSVIHVCRKDEFGKGRHCFIWQSLICICAALIMHLYIVRCLAEGYLTNPFAEKYMYDYSRKLFAAKGHKKSVIFIQ